MANEVVQRVSQASHRIVSLAPHPKDANAIVAGYKLPRAPNVSAIDWVLRFKSMENELNVEGQKNMLMRVMVLLNGEFSKEPATLARIIEVLKTLPLAPAPGSIVTVVDSNLSTD